MTRALELIPLVLGAESGGKMADPVAHVVNHPAVWNESGLWLWSAHMGNLVLSGLLLVLVMSWAARHISTKPSAAGADKYITRNPLAHMIEVICVFLRDQTVRPLLGERTDRFMPFLWTLFFFILINNLLGLVPLMDLQHLVSPELRRSHTAWVGGTATQSLFVTGVLALIAFVVVNVAGIRELGLKGYLRHLTGGAPVFIWPILVPVEVMGIFIRPVALALRLFANMTAGHILVATLLIFAGVGVTRLAGGGGLDIALGGTITLLSFVATIAIMFLELFVAFLQAFVFMFLTTVFISQLSHHGDHEHEHHGAPGHEHAHA